MQIIENKNISYNLSILLEFCIFADIKMSDQTKQLKAKCRNRHDCQSVTQISAILPNLLCKQNGSRYFSDDYQQ